APVVVSPPPAGERVEVDLDSTPVIRLAVDLAGAHVDVIDGKIVVTLANGGVIVLEGDAVQQFLAGGDAAIDQFLTAAAGNPDAAAVGPIDETSGASFAQGGPVPQFASPFEAAGTLAGTDLSYKTPILSEMALTPEQAAAGSILPGDNPPVADAN